MPVGKEIESVFEQWFSPSLHIKVPGEIKTCPVPKLHPSLSPIKSKSPVGVPGNQHSVGFTGDSIVQPRV